MDTFQRFSHKDIDLYTCRGNVALSFYIKFNLFLETPRVRKDVCGHAKERACGFRYEEPGHF